MTEVLPEFRYLRPGTVEEAVALHRENGAARYVSGGTDLVPNLRRGLGAPEALIDLTGIAELAAVSDGVSGLSIGAAVTLSDLAANEAVRKDYPALAEAAGSVAGPGHRAAGTVGGNLCLDTRCVFYNQSQWWREANDFCLKYQGEICHVAPKGKICHAAFSGDLAPALLVYGAEVEVAGAEGSRRMTLDQLYTGKGDDYLALAPGELVSAVHLPPDPPPASYAKMRVRGAIDFPLAGVAVALVRKRGKVERLRIAITGTNPKPFLVEGTGQFEGATLDEDVLRALGETVQKQVSPMRTTLILPFARRRIVAELARRQAATLFAG